MFTFEKSTLANVMNWLQEGFMNGYEAMISHVAHAALTEICHQVQCNIERTNKSQPSLALAKAGNTVKGKLYTL